MKKYYLLLLLISSTFVFGQENVKGLYLGLQSSIPNSAFGLTAAIYNQDYISYYISVGTNYLKPDNIYSDINFDKAVNHYSDIPLNEKKYIYYIKLGLAKRIYKIFGLKLGVAFSTKEKYQNFFDKDKVFGNNGSYYILKEKASFVGLDLSVQTFYKNFILDVGADSQPGGIVVGISYIIQGW